MKKVVILYRLNLTIFNWLRSVLEMKNYKNCLKLKNFQKFGVCDIFKKEIH